MSVNASLLGLPLAPVFLGYVVLMAAVVAGVLLRYLPLGRALFGIVIVSVWIAYAGAMGYLRVLRDPTLVPPGIFRLAIPIIAFAALVLGRSRVGRYLATSLPLPLILALQTFRVGVEVTLSALHHAGLASGLLTLSGGNVEVLFGISAPLAALVSSRGFGGRRLAFAWNVLGLLSLVNVASRAVLTAPGPLHLIPSEIPTIAMGMFPFSFIPGFMAPLAMMLHLLAFRALRVATEVKPVPIKQTHLAY